MADKKSNVTFTSDYIKAANIKHNFAYGYDINSPTLKLKSKIKIICKIHGTFLQRADSHKNGARCKNCVSDNSKGINNHKHKAMLKRVNSLSITNVDILNAADSAHITYRCSKHGNLIGTLYWLAKYKKCKECYQEQKNKSFRYKGSDKFKYYKMVEWHTRKNWKYHEKFINHYNLIRSKHLFHLDHMYSIDEGFKNNVPPYVIGHWTNLFLIPSKDNILKSNRSSVDLDVLYKSYQWAIKKFPHTHPQSYTNRNRILT